MTHDDELIERVAKATWDEMALRHAWQMTWEQARQYPIHRNAEWSRAALAIDTVRTYDREQRAKIDEALARHNEARHGGMNMYVETRRDPDDYRDPFSLVTRMARGPGITEG